MCMSQLSNDLPLSYRHLERPCSYWIELQPQRGLAGWLDKLDKRCCEWWLTLSRQTEYKVKKGFKMTRESWNFWEQPGLKYVLLQALVKNVPIRSSRLNWITPCFNIPPWVIPSFHFIVKRCTWSQKCLITFYMQTMNHLMTVHEQQLKLLLFFMDFKAFSYMPCLSELGTKHTNIEVILLPCF